MNLKNKYVLVTGSSSGIGQAIAIECAKLGANVLINYRKNKKGAEFTLSEVRKVGSEGYIFQADLSVPSEVNKLFEEIKKQNLKINILVNSAGESPAGDLGDSVMWNKVFKNSLFSVINTSDEFLKQRPKGQLAKIVNISSVYGFWDMGNPIYLQYTTAKAAIISLTYSLAKQLSPDVLVNAVAPGYTMTPNWDGTSEEELKEATELNKIKRFIKPEEIATMVVEILKNDAVTGEVIRVDGGLHLQDIL